MTSGEAHNFTFRKNDSVGAADAEEDSAVLAECFVDTGDLTALFDCTDSKRIVIGRTGAGKTAIVATIEDRKPHVIKLALQSLSLNYIANNNVIQFFEEAGVNLTPFYTLLWRHILVVELLRTKYKINNEDSQRKTMGRLRELLNKKDRFKDLAIEYLETWGNKFWLTTEERISELTSRVEKNLTGVVGGSIQATEFSIKGARSLSEEARQEIIQRGKQAVSQVQIRELENIIHVLAEDVFDDPLDPYYVTVDTLDEEWVDDRIKYRLIKALIDTARSFRKVPHVKVILALRQDLLQKVLTNSLDPGFQVEKYESLFLFLTWSKPQLTELLEKRLNFLIRRRYTSKPIACKDILPNAVDGKDAVDYILERTFMRPRDAILFLNECIACADGRPQITATAIKKAEEPYSAGRLQSLAYEWQINFPALKSIAHMFYGLPVSFPLSDITKEFLEERFQLAMVDIDPNKKDKNVDLLNSLYSAQGNFSSVRNILIRNLYDVGLLGVKAGPTSAVSWNISSRPHSALSAGELRPSSTLVIHPMFHRVLGVRH